MLEEETFIDPVFVGLAGEIDMQSVEEISTPIFDALADGGFVHLQVDCSGVTFIESRGLTMMARAQRIADEQGALLEWVNPPAPMLNVIRVTGLSDYLRISIIP